MLASFARSCHAAAQPHKQLRTEISACVLRRDGAAADVSAIASQGTCIGIAPLRTVGAERLARRLRVELSDLLVSSPFVPYSVAHLCCMHLHGLDVMCLWPSLLDGAII